MAAVKSVDAADVLEADVIASAESRIEVDSLKEGWQVFLNDLKNAPNGLDDSLAVLRVRRQFIERDWSKEFTKEELDIMFGIAPYYAFGNLKQLKQNQGHFQGGENLQVRKEIGVLLEKVLKLREFHAAIVKGLVQQLLDMLYFGPALATRLLVLARPDFFVVVNSKSFEGLQERFGLFVTNQNFKAGSYVALLEKIHSQPWFKSPEPDDPAERELWQARAALIDVLVYREKPGRDD